jgi:hypothetical protein
MDKEVENILAELETAYHEVGHAYAYVPQTRYIAAQASVSSALEALGKAYDALDAIMDGPGSAEKKAVQP